MKELLNPIDNNLKSSPLVSVIMTVYNGEKAVNAAIDSILLQTYTNFEFIIIDDGSIDNTVDIIQSYDDERLRFIKQAHRGRSTSLNHSIKLAKGFYIANIDADDMAIPTRLEKQIDFFRAHPEIHLLGTCGIEVNEYSGKNKSILMPLNDKDIRLAIAFYCPFIHSSVMIRKSVFKQVGFYNERLTCSIDMDLWVRIISQYTVANLPDLLVKKRIHPLQSFRIVKESLRFRNEARLCWKAARGLTLPFPVKLSSFLFFIYSILPSILRKAIKNSLPSRLVGTSLKSRKGWIIK